MPQPQSQRKRLKQKPRNVYNGKPLTLEQRAQIERAAQITAAEIAKLKAEFLAALNEWADRGGK